MTTTEIRFFQQLMNSNRLSAYYTGQAVAVLSADLAQAFTGMLRTHLIRYVQLPDIRKQIDSSEDFNVQLKAVLDIFPSFLFVVIGELNTHPGAYVAVRRLLIAAIIFVADRTMVQQLYIQLFIEGLQHKEKLSLSADPMDPEMMVLPEVVFRDFLSLTEQPIRFASTKSSPEMIENIFCFTGLSQVFMKYFFDLFAETKDPRLSQQINVIFSKLFVSLRLEEIRFWKGYKNSTIIQNRLYELIDANSPRMRHPKLQKDVFVEMANYNPIIHNGSSRGMTTKTQAILKAQLTAFHSLSVVQTTLLMNIVYRFKGDDYVVYLISQIVKADRERLKELDEYLSRQQQKSLKALQILIGSFVKRFFPETRTTPAKAETTGKAIQYSSESARLAQAKKNIEALGDRKGMMTHDKVAKYLEERLKKLFEKVKMSGALTADKVPEYLAQFAEAAQTVLTETDPSLQKEVIEAFEESTDDILNEITRFSEMSTDEVNSIRSDIYEKMAELDTPDLDKRTEVVEEIGMALSGVSEQVETEAASPPAKKVDLESFLANEQVSIGFDDKAPLVPLGEFFKLPFGERKGPPEDDWFVFHKRYLKLAVENNRLDSSILEVLPEIEAQVPRLKYRKYFNIFPNGEYEDPTCSAVYDIWKSSALERLRME